MIAKEPLVSDVKLTDVQSDNLYDPSTKITYQCNFCLKDANAYDQNIKMLEALSGEHFHCAFCIRHGFHTKRKKNILIASFRGIIGYMYYALYKMTNEYKICVLELQDLINQHEQIGLLNPAFSYDRETYYWFVDFEKIGNSKKQIPINDIICTFNDILTAFNLYEYIEFFRLYSVVDKYKKAIMEFYQYRSRPKDKKILIPTMKGTGAPESIQYNQSNFVKYTKIPMEETRNFLPHMLKIKK